MARQVELISAFADRYAEYQDPFHDNTLRDLDVRFSECMDLSALIGLILKGYVNASPGMRAEILLLGGGVCDMETVQYVRDKAKQRALIEQMKAIEL